MYYDQSGQSYPNSIAKTVFSLWLAAHPTTKVTIANGDVTNWWYLTAGAPLITSTPVPIDRITPARQTIVSTGGAEALFSAFSSPMDLMKYLTQ